MTQAIFDINYNGGMGPYSWTSPTSGVVLAEAWGGGGGGDINNSGPAGAGGGGGGAYSYANILVSSGQTYNFHYGSQGLGSTDSSTGRATDGESSWFVNASTLFAASGQAGNGFVGGSGGRVIDCIGTAYAGGSGANGDISTGNGGGGGGAGGLSSKGGDGNGISGGIGTGFGGNGGSGGGPFSNPSPLVGSLPGGGGGGGGFNGMMGNDGYDGAGGRITLTWDIPPNNINNDIPLFLKCYDVLTSGIPLYLKCPEPLANTLPLFLEYFNTINSGVPLFVWGDSAITGNFPLYIDGYSPISGNFPLYVEVYSPISGAFPLFIDVPSAISGCIHLYTYGQTLTSSFGEMILFLQNPFNTNNTNLPLYIYGANIGTNGLSKEVDLFIFGTTAANSGSMPLFLQTVTTGIKHCYMNLWEQGCAYTISNNTTLFIQNNQSGCINILPLFIQGSGIGDGSLPCSNYLNLFLDCGTSAVIPLFINGPGYPNTGTFQLYIWGNSFNSGIISLVMPYTYAADINTITLFTGGF